MDYAPELNNMTYCTKIQQLEATYSINVGKSELCSEENPPDID
jgi:hypothetical protein